MSRRKKEEEVAAGDRLLTQLLDRLPANPTTVAIRAYVEQLRLDALRPRPTPRTKGARLKRDLEDAEVTYLRAREQGSTQAMVSAQRQRREIQEELEAWSADQEQGETPMTLPELSRLVADEFPAMYRADPDAWRAALKAIGKVLDP